MRHPRTTIARFMALIVLIALEITIARVGLSTETTRVVRKFAFHVVLISFAAQIGLYLAIRSGPGLRRFWLGFTIFGVFSAATLVAWWPVLNVPWIWYFAYVEARFREWTAFSNYLRSHFGAHECVGATIYFLPQLATALVGGCLAYLAGEIRPAIVADR